MTRPFNQQWQCPNCKTITAQESLFSAWIRGREDLDSAKGFVVADMDYFIHRYKTHAGREFQCLMFIEVKCFGADLSASQRDTLSLVNQIMRNRRATPTWSPNRQVDNTIVKARSILSGRDVLAKLFGGHLLQFTGGGPQDSHTIRWHGKTIDEETLAALLRFDLDPDTLRPLDLRNHHSKPYDTQLPFC